MELTEAIHNRRAVRDYTAQPVEEAQLRALIDAAIQAPSAMNRQPWSFCVVRDQKLLARISREAKARLLHSTAAGLVSHHFEDMLENEAFHIFYHAPAMILISTVEDNEWAQIDCALAGENLMLAAQDMGLGSCWIGFAQAWLRTDEGKAALGLPSSWTPVAPIIVGHARAAMPPVPRRTPEILWVD